MGKEGAGGGKEGVGEKRREWDGEARRERELTSNPVLIRECHPYFIFSLCLSFSLASLSLSAASS